jgi:hypothetical protein
MGVLTQSTLPFPSCLRAWMKELLRHQSLNVVFTGHCCLGWCSNFVDSESGQKQSVKLLQNMVYNTTQHPCTHPTPLQPHTVCIVYILYVYLRKGEREGEVREKVEGQQYTRGVENTNMTDCISKSINSMKKNTSKDEI